MFLKLAYLPSKLVCLFSFSNFTFGFPCFLKKLKIIQYDFQLNWCAEEKQLVVNNKADNRVFMSRNYRSGSCSLKI